MPTVQKDYSNYLEDYYGIDAQKFNPVNTNINTILGRQLDGNQSPHEASKRLDNSLELLQNVKDVLKDNKSSQKLKKATAKMIDNSTMPLVDVVSSVTHHAANIVSPIASSGYAHAREETERKRQITRSNLQKSAKEVMINKFVHSKGCSLTSTSSSSQDATPSNTNKMTTRKKRKASLPISIPYPPKPANGREYGVGEFFSIVCTYTK